MLLSLSALSGKEYQHQSVPCMRIAAHCSHATNDHCTQVFAMGGNARSDVAGRCLVEPALRRQGRHYLGIWRWPNTRSAFRRPVWGCSHRPCRVQPAGEPGRAQHLPWLTLVATGRQHPGYCHIQRDLLSHPAGFRPSPAMGSKLAAGSHALYGIKCTGHVPHVLGHALAAPAHELDKVSPSGE